MARGKSVIDVLIIGDAKRLVGAFNQANAATGGLVGSLTKAFLGAKVVGEGFEFLQDSLGEADRLGDAVARLNGQIGELDTAKLQETADDFIALGQSKQDILEMESNFADLATSVGIADNQITVFAPRVAEAAAALSLLREEDPSTLMDLIGKAAGGSAKAAKELGVSLIDTNDSAAQLNNILTQLIPTVDSVTKGSGDLEQKQAGLQAQMETLSASVGQAVEGPLTDLLTFINDEIAAIPHAIEGWQMLGRAVENFGRDALAPIARVNDALGALGDALRSVGNLIPDIGGGGAFDEQDIVNAQRRNRERNGI